jgi:hypothetical protein
VQHSLRLLKKLDNKIYVDTLKSKFAFYVSLVALVFGCVAILDLVVGEGVTGWLFAIGVIGNLVSVPLSVILELTAKK